MVVLQHPTNGNGGVLTMCDRGRHGSFDRYAHAGGHAEAFEVFPGPLVLELVQDLGHGVVCLGQAA